MSQQVTNRLKRAFEAEPVSPPSPGEPAAETGVFPADEPLIERVAKERRGELTVPLRADIPWRGGAPPPNPADAWEQFDQICYKNNVCATSAVVGAALAGINIQGAGQMPLILAHCATAAEAHAIVRTVAANTWAHARAADVRRNEQSLKHWRRLLRQTNGLVHALRRCFQLNVPLKYLNAWWDDHIHELPKLRYPTLRLLYFDGNDESIRYIIAGEYIRFTKEHRVYERESWRLLAASQDRYHPEIARLEYLKYEAILPLDYLAEIEATIARAQRAATAIGLAAGRDPALAGAMGAAATTAMARFGTVLGRALRARVAAHTRGGSDYYDVPDRLSWQNVLYPHGRVVPEPK